MGADTSQVTVIVQGCDDSTRVALNLTADELDTVRRVASAIKQASQDTCQPTLEVVA